MMYFKLGDESKKKRFFLVGGDDRNLIRDELIVDG